MYHVSKSRRSTHSVMCHPKFSDVVIIKNGLSFSIPQNLIGESGIIETSLSTQINSCKSVADAIALNELGVGVSMDMPISMA